MSLSPGDIARLERLGMHAWPPAAVEQIQGWRLGFTEGVTRRANSVLPLAWLDGADSASALQEVERRYRLRKLRPCFKMTSAAEPAALEPALDARGYGREGNSLVLTAATAAVASGTEGRAEVRLLPEATADWLATAWPATKDPQLQRVRKALLGRIAPPHVFALAFSSGRPCGAALAVAEEGWAGITAVQTLAAYRRQGVARDIFRALARWARDQGQGSLYLQVEADNEAGTGLYESVGFRFAYGYHYRTIEA